MKYSSGNTYTGQWLDGEPNGQGSLVDRQQKLVYDGQFLRGKKHGQGRCQWADPKTGEAHASYDGQWEEDARHGQGHYIEYNVAFKTAESTKRITLTYEGSWFRGMRSGAGKQWYTDQGSDGRDFAVYDGSWEDDQHSGFGVLKDDQGSYRGEWQRGQRHGHGVVLNTAREELFNGQYFEGRRVNSSSRTPALSSVGGAGMGTQPSASSSSSKRNSTKHSSSKHASISRGGSSKPSYPQSFSPKTAPAHAYAPTSVATTGESAASGYSPHTNYHAQASLPPQPRR
jgi:hypothetical protein